MKKQSVNNSGITKTQLVNSAFPKSANVGQDVLDAIETITIKRNGNWTILKNAPAGNGKKALIWFAVKNARHAVNWNNLAAWNEGLTGRLIMASEEDREFFNKAFDQLVVGFLALQNESKADKKKRLSENEKIAKAFAKK